MPLRYFQPREKSYIPDYSPISTQLLAQTYGNVAQQELVELDRIDQLSAARREMVGGLQGITDEQRMEASGLFEDVDTRINEHVERHGARGARQKVGSMAREFEERIRPYGQASQTYASVQERLKDSKADRGIIAWATQNLGKIQYNDEGDAVGYNQNLETQHRVQVLESWVPIHERLHQFNTRQRKGDRFETPYYGQMSHDDGTPVTAGDQLQYFRQMIEEVSKEGVIAENFAHLMSDPQMVRQLTLQGEMELDMMNRAEEQNPDIERKVTVNEDGSVNATVSKLRVNNNKQFLDENGRVVEDPRDAAVVEKKVLYSSIAKWQAMKSIEPYASRESYRHVSTDIKFAGSGSVVDRLSITDLMSFPLGAANEEMKPSDFYRVFREEQKQLTDNHNSTIEKIGHLVENLGYSYDINPESGEGMIQIDERAFSLDSALEKGHIGEHTYRRLSNLDNIRQTHRRNIEHNKARVKSIEESVINTLYQDSKYQDLVGDLEDPNIYFDDSGRIRLKEDFIKENIDAFNLKKVMTVAKDKSAKDKRMPESRVVGRVSGGWERYDENTIIASPRDNNYYLIKDGAVYRVEHDIINDATKDLDRKVREFTGTAVASNTYVFESNYSKVHERVLNIFDTISPGYKTALSHPGNLRTMDGKNVVLDTGENFHLVGFGFHSVTGDFELRGHIIDEESGEPVEGKALISVSGQLSDQMARQLFDEDNYRAIMANSLWSSFLPQVYEADNKEINISRQNLGELGLVKADGESYKTLNNVSIKHSRKRTNGEISDIFVIKIDGKRVDIAHDWFDARSILEQETIRL